MAAAVAGVKAIAAAVIESVVAVAVKASAVLGLITLAKAVVAIVRGEVDIIQQ